jgi:hypothetical protein
MKKVISFFENLSIVPVLVAIVNGYAFYKLQGDQVNVMALFALASICWSIYILDGIFDNTKFEYESLSGRHLFIKKHQFNLSGVVIGIVVINIVLLFFQKKEVLQFGVFTASWVVLYLTSINKFKRFRLRKELFMPLIFALASCGIPIFQKTSVNLSTWILTILFFLLTLQNAFIISWFENNYGENKKTIFQTIRLKTGKRVINYINIILIAFYLIFFANGSEFKNQLALVYMCIGLGASFCLTQSPKLSISYRIVLDSLLLLPFVLLIFYFGF